MRAWMSVTAGISLCLALHVAAQAEEPKDTLTLVTGGKSDYRIVLPEAASPQEKRAAEELRDFLKQISGATLPVVTDNEPAADKEVLLGRNRHLESADGKINFDKLGAEGFTIRTLGSRLAIAGGSGLGTLYGVYAFLEDHLGCRWYTPKVAAIPSRQDIVLNSIDDIQVPAMAYREVYYAEARDRDFSMRQRLNAGFASPQPGDTAEELASGNGLAHTLFSFLPPEKYFDAHPEYFALRDGKRQPTQPCLTNPDVLRIVVENLQKAMAANPKAKYWSVSQMDNGDPCACEKCKAIDDREGSPSGSLVEFVNRVAEQCPDKIISTLAYWYTMGPPKTVKPARNVLIVFCIDASRAAPFPEWLDGWSKIAARMYVWYYVIPCHNFIAPWPNLRLLQPQIKEYATHGASGMFNEGGYNAGSEFAELRTYMLAKLMWNPDRDAGAIVDDFLKGYYGPAAASIRKYIDLMHDSFHASTEVLDGHHWSRDHAGSFLSPAMFARYDPLFDEAEKAVADNPDLLLRVQHARMPLMHAELQLAYGDVDKRIAMARKLKDVAARTGTDYFSDFNIRPREQYLAQVMDGLQKEKAAKH